MHVYTGFSLRIVVAGEQCKVTGELLGKSEALSGNERNLAREFCIVDGEFSDLLRLMNTLCTLFAYSNRLILFSFFCRLISGLWELPQLNSPKANLLIQIFIP